MNPRARRPDRLACVGASLLAGAIAASCGGTAPSSSGPTSEPTRPTPGATVETPPPEPSDPFLATDSPPELPVLEDTAFLAEAAGACEATRPDDVHAVAGPKDPPGKLPGYEWLHIVVTDMRGEDGKVGPAPPLPPGQTFWQPATTLVTIPGGSGALAIEAPIGAWVQVLACVALRTGNSKTYSAEREVRVTALDAVAWLVDRASGQRVVEPWVVEAEMGILLNLDLVVRYERLNLNVADLRADLTYLLAQAVPLDGVYHGGRDSSVVAEHDKPLDLPPGTRLLPGITFVLRLVVLPGEPADTIDFVEVLCAPVGRIAASPLRVATGVVHDLGAFSARSADVAIEGEFRSEFEAKGRIRALSPAAEACGIPGSADWYVNLSAMVEGAGDGYRIVVP